MMDPNIGTGYYQPEQPGHGSQQQTTTVIIQQPQSMLTVQNSREWQRGICGCFEDLGECMSVDYNVNLYITARSRTSVYGRV